MRILEKHFDLITMYRRNEIPQQPLTFRFNGDRLRYKFS